MNLFIYCAGGFGKEVFDTAKRVNKSDRKWNEIYFIDDDLSLGSEFYHTKLFSLSEVLEKNNVKSFEVLIANGEPTIRKMLYDRLKAKDIKLATLIDGTAVVSDTAYIGDGVIVTAYCSISSNALVGNNVAINTKSIVGHDVKVGDHAVISSLVNIGGATPVGEASYLGMGAQIKEGLMIGKDVIIGMGSVVYSDIPDGVIALGNPARPMRRNEEKRVFHRTKSKGVFIS